MNFHHEKSKQTNVAVCFFFFFVKRGCLLVMHLYVFCKTWSIVEHGVMCYFGVVSLSLSKITTQAHRVSKGAKIKNRYNQVPHLTQDTNGKVTNLQFDNINESQEVSPFPAGDHKAHINRHAKGHSKHKTEKKIRLETVSKIFYWRA